MGLSRITRRLERLFDWVPTGHDALHSLSDLVRDDLAQATDVRDLLEPLDTDELDVDRWFSAGRPRIRPLLVVLSARASGASEVESEIQYAVELLHAALVVHDLALGQSGGLRRRVARRILDRSVGWMSGNHLTFRAMELVRQLPGPEVLGEMVLTLREFAEGQALATGLQRGGMPAVSDWMDHVDRHTGALFAFCCRAGALVAQDDPAVVSALGRFGRHTGRVWNVAEDLSALQSEDGAVHLLQRALAGRPVLPVIVCAEHRPEAATLWNRLVTEPDLAIAEDLLVVIQASPATRDSRARMLQESWSARRALARLPDSPYRRGMEKLVAGLLRSA